MNIARCEIDHRPFFPLSISRHAVRHPWQRLKSRPPPFSRFRSRLFLSVTTPGSVFVLRKRLKNFSSFPTSSRDDVRTSLDILDSVIGEFDDGLLSSAESEYIHDHRDTNNKAKKSKKRANSNHAVPEATAPSSHNRRALDHRIDDIFSEATNEVVEYPASSRHSGGGGSGGKRRRSPTRRVDDPLPVPPQPVPPTPPPMPGGGGGEVIVYGEPEARSSHSPPTTSVKAQIHSLEQKGFGQSRAQQQRSRSENPPLARKGFSYTNPNYTTK